MLRVAIDFVFRPRMFKPTFVADSFSQGVEKLIKKGAQTVIFDKDDTLTKLHEFTVEDQDIKKAVQKLRQQQVKMFIVSNSIKDMDPTQVEQIPIRRTTVKKPYNHGQIKEWLINQSPQTVFIVGDRLMTDIYLANLLGVRSVLVPPVQSSSIAKHGLWVCLFRRIQGLLLRMIQDR